MSHTKLILKGIILLFLIVTGLECVSCSEQSFTSNPNDKVSFSKDTVSFDTVFTAVGSVTSKFLVYNKHKNAIKISSISLAGGGNSPFKVNVDGVLSSNNHFSEIEIKGKDSLYVFVSVTLDLNRSANPLLVKDSLIFVTNGNVQKVNLRAYGQDVVMFKNKLIKNDTTLTSDKPYLVYGNLTVDTAKTLTLERGVRLYFHNNANLVVLGNLIANGSLEEPVIMRGDRLDKLDFEEPVPYNFVAGQWGGVYLLWNKAHHSLNYLFANSGNIGLYYANNTDRNTLPNLEMTNCKIHNFQNYGLVAINGNLTVLNSEISNTGSYNVFLQGGKHVFVQTTIVNYFNNSVQPINRENKPALLISELDHSAPMQTILLNCVLCGSLENEYALVSNFPNQYRATFEHCYLKMPKSDSPMFNNVRWYAEKDTIFKSINYNLEKRIYYNFTPDSVSPLRGLADPSVITNYHLQYDLMGNLRDDKPDAGAYEWMPSKH